MAERNITEDPKMVKVYYCKCGQTVQLVSTLPHAQTDRPTRKNFRDAEKWGRKVETMTLAEFKKKPFMCTGVVDCPDEDTMRYYPQGFKINKNEL